MGFSYQLNALTEEELAKDAKEEFGETKNLMEVLFSLLWGSLVGHLNRVLFSDFNERLEDVDGKIAPPPLNPAG